MSDKTKQDLEDIKVKLAGLKETIENGAKEILELEDQMKELERAREE